MAGRTALILVAALALGRSSTEAQTPSLPIPVRVDTLVSAKVGEPREFWVSLPDRYNDSGEKYPVLYMMDGDFNFTSGVIGGVRQAASLGEIPEFIIVGIKNTNRSKDIFPEEVTYRDGSKDGGRANQYLDFVRDELIPRVAKTYRTTDYRILYGTSNTGFTAVHALFRNPDLANAYIAASATLSIPSFRTGRDDLVGAFKGGRRDLVLVMGEYDFPTVVSHNGMLKEAIGTKAPAGLSCRLRVIENGEHVPPDALVEGLRVLFQGWKVTRPLTESSFAEIRAQVDGRLEKFGVPGRIDEDALKGLGNSLLGEKKLAKALEVLEYRAASYPQSADAQVALGDAYRQSGNMEKARECYTRALAIAPGHAAATARLKGDEKALDTSVKYLPSTLRRCSDSRRTKATSAATASPYRRMARGSTTPKSPTPGATTTSGTTRRLRGRRSVHQFQRKRRFLVGSEEPRRDDQYTGV